MTLLLTSGRIGWVGFTTTPSGPVKYVASGPFFSWSDGTGDGFV